MRPQELSRISAEERAIVEEFTSQAPVKLGGLAKSLGVSIKVSSLRTGVSGQISNENGNYIIRVNRHEARERQRFTIAHELAHFLLHRSIIDSMQGGITDTVLYRSGAPERIEFEANRLGSEIVMPMQLVDRSLSENFRGIVTEATIEALAYEFQVSKAAMEVQLSKLVGA